MTKILLVLVGMIMLSIVPVYGQQQCTLQDDEFFVTFHPHLDAFWLNTDDELKNQNFRPAGFLYNMNQRNSKQILDSMLNALKSDSKRKYFVTEIVFFKDWYDNLSGATKQQVKKVVKNKQLEIGNSGWVENDQAVCYYDDILDQYTIGMKFMYEEFGYINRIGWSTDSFGHSHSQVALQHLMGFDFQSIERVDDRYVYQRKDHPLLEFYWQPVSDSNGRKYGGVLNYVRHFLHEVNDLRRTTEKSIEADFLKLKENMDKLYKKNKYFRFLGNDFEEFIDTEFTNLEKGFTLLNAGSPATCSKYKYGNPSDYLNQLKAFYGQHQVQTRQHDFIPNWDQDRHWSGYYTTDPQLKIICKDFSRLINLFRKRLVKGFTDDHQVIATYGKTLNTAEELLAIMQHHDGITATSKAHIETLFKTRMSNSSKQIISSLKQIESISQEEICEFYKNGNKCNITKKEEKLNLIVYHEGIIKTQKLELNLPEGFIYEVEDKDQSIVQADPTTQKFSMIFQAQLKPGQNIFILNGVEQSAFKGKIQQYEEVKDGVYQAEGIKVSVEHQTIAYSFGDNFMKFSFQVSANSGSRRKTVAWNKYGNRNDKTESVSPGIYIMSNSGQLKELQINIQSIHSVSFANHKRFYIKYNQGFIMLQTNNNNPSHIDYQFSFIPPGRNYADYFLKVDSNVKNSNSEFYHDSNGYLVAKRKIGSRPDYEWDYKPQDKINANTYPVCSFFYVTEGEKKIVFFTDRAQGVTTYDGSILINIDRLAQDDYKGVGQSYNFVRQNHFRYKFAITGVNDDIERNWQRSYDQALLGFIAHDVDATQFTENSNARQSPDSMIQYLKYSLSFLNGQEVLLRLHNLGERNNLKISKFGAKSLSIPELNLQLTYEDIRESFANGLIVKQRYNWIGSDEQINHFTRSTLDTAEDYVLQPLEIRSFRINFNFRIQDKEASSTQGHKLTPQMIKQIDTENAVTLIKHSLRKRCF